MFVHHVFFYMSPTATEAEKAELRKGIETLTQIETIQQWHIGVPAPTNREVIEKGYTWSWLSIFADSAAEGVYQIHPVHLDFVKNYSHLWTRVVVYDSL